MKFLQQLFLMTFLLCMLAGCGDGGGDYNGNLSVVASNTSTTASFTIQYAKSGVTNYAGLGCKIRTTINGVLVDSDPIIFSSSGIMVLSYGGLEPGDYVRLEAQVGDIVSSAAVTIADAALSVSPTTIDISGLSVGSASPAISVSGGSGSYTFASGNTDVEVTKVSTGTFTLSKTNTDTGTATITVTDDNTAETATVTVTY